MNFLMGLLAKVFTGLFDSAAGLIKGKWTEEKNEANAATVLAQKGQLESIKAADKEEAGYKDIIPVKPVFTATDAKKAWGVPPTIILFALLLCLPGCFTKQTHTDGKRPLLPVIKPPAAYFDGPETLTAREQAMDAYCRYLFQIITQYNDNSTSLNIKNGYIDAPVKPPLKPLAIPK